jgi:hypothetical protein
MKEPWATLVFAIPALLVIILVIVGALDRSR